MHSCGNIWHDILVNVMLGLGALPGAFFVLAGVWKKVRSRIKA